MRFKKLLLLLLWVLCNQCISAQEVIILNSQNEYKLLGAENLRIFIDTTAKMSVQEVSETESNFKKCEGDIPHHGVSENNFWINFKLRNIGDSSRTIITLQNPVLENVEFYYRTGKGPFQMQRISKNEAFSKRKYPSQNFIFNLPLTDKLEIFDCYFKINSFTEVQAPLYVGTLTATLGAGLKSDYSFGIYTGIMLVIFLYNLFIFVMVRDKSYLYYILYIFSVAFVQISLQGFGFKYLWGDQPYFEAISPFLFSSLTAFTSIAFIRNFLQVKLYARKLNHVFSVIFVLYAITLCLGLAGQRHNAFNLLNLLALILSLLMLGTAGYIWAKQKTRSSFFFIIAWSAFLLSIIAFVLKDVGVLPYNNLTASAIQIGSAIEAILLSFALADRINILKKEKEASQAEALRVSMENEKIIREQNVMLEQKVEERTMELQETNQELNVTLNKLKDAQTQLVDAEKMASLGQLTAGLAHEINNPINFVSSNIRPLRRDIGDVMELLDKYQKLETYELSAELSTQMKLIDDYKKEIDFGYIKDEIEILLKGMDEGSSRTVEIVKSLKNFSRLDEADLKNANINEGINSTLVLLNNQLGGIKVIKELGSIPDIECYPGKLNQVFMNILNNGIYAVRRKGGGEPPRIHVKTSFENNHVIIRIGDNGTGMSQETKNKIFEPFFTTKEVGEGTGLGLSIVYKIIEAHNGNIKVVSEPDEGTEFIIELPKSPQINIPLSGKTDE